MSIWESYPADYRAGEVKSILEAVRSGECVSVVGLSGAGKSNLLGFLAYRKSRAEYPLVLVDANRLLEHTPSALFRLARHALGRPEPVPPPEAPRSEVEALSQAIDDHLKEARGLSLLFDRFDIFTAQSNRPLFNTLRALRDANKFRLSYVLATRRPLPADNELAELFFAHTLWLGPLSHNDAHWNVSRYMGRIGQRWPEGVAQELIDLSRGYPSLLKGACEAYAATGDLAAVAGHPAVRARVADFWSDSPGEKDLASAGLADHPLLLRGRGPVILDEQLTAKEQLLLDYFRTHPDQVCDKDDLIQAVWPEDRVFEQGVRDSSLAQLLRRLRLKIEPEPAEPQFIQTVPGRGYLYRSRS